MAEGGQFHPALKGSAKWLTEPPGKRAPTHRNGRPFGTLAAGAHWITPGRSQRTQPILMNSGDDPSWGKTAFPGRRTLTTFWRRTACFRTDGSLKMSLRLFPGLVGLGVALT